MNFQMPTRIVFTSGAIASLKAVIHDDLKAKKPFLVTDKGMIQTGLIEKINDQVGSLEVFDDVEPNPRSTTVNRAGEHVRKIQPDLIIALGGGSAMDAAKAVALLATNDGKIEDYEGKEKYEAAPLPVIAIPTTCGTGSEVTWVSVITDTERKFKMSIKGIEMFPSVALVDPDLLMTLPGPVVASTGLDALTHAIEAYTSKPASPITDLFALKAIKLIFNSLETAFRNIESEKEARENLMLGSTMAGVAFGNSDVGAVHCISESIGALFDIPHGVANALFLPYVMQFNVPACTERFADIAAAAGIDEKSSQADADRLIEKIKSLSHVLGIPLFKELGINKDQFAKIAEYSFKNNSNPSNPRDTSVEDYLNILETAYTD